METRGQETEDRTPPWSPNTGVHCPPDSGPHAAPSTFCAHLLALQGKAQDERDVSAPGRQGPDLSWPPHSAGPSTQGACSVLTDALPGLFPAKAPLQVMTTLPPPGVSVNLQTAHSTGPLSGDYAVRRPRKP